MLVKESVYCCAYANVHNNYIYFTNSGRHFIILAAERESDC